MTKFAHINIITDDWKKLSDFYIKVFDCEPILPRRDLKGEWLSKATGIESVHIQGIHLLLPGGDENQLTLEIFQYSENEENLPSRVNRKGFGHIAFKVDSVEDTLNKVLEHGGSQIGDIVKTEIVDSGTITFVYAKDIDGNILELQKWE